MAIALAGLAVPARGEARTRLRPLRWDHLSALNRATRLGDASDGRRMRIGVAIGHPDPSGEDAFLAGLYDPGSRDFHRFLSPAAFAARFGVSKADARSVRGWATSTGL